MADFQPIETQEEFDRLIGERLKRERETLESKYSDYNDLSTANKDLQKQVDELTKSLNETTASVKDKETALESLQAQVSKHEKDAMKTRIAHELNLPYELAGRINGDDEKSMRADAESLATYIGNQGPTHPMRNTEEPKKEGLEAAYSSLAKGLNLGE